MAVYVLIVDDSRAMRRIQRNVVSELGDIEILEAEDGLAAIHVLKNNEFRVDLILLDWMMPRMDGLTLVKLLKGNGNLNKIPILMVTSVSDERKISQAWRAGVDGVLLKPFTKEMLLHSILSLKPGGFSEVNTVMKLDRGSQGGGKSFLEELPEEMYDQILDMAQKIIMPDRTAFLLHGMPVPQFFFVFDGMVEEHQASTGDDEGSKVRTYGPGECFGVNELMSGDELSCNFIVTEKSKIGCISKTDFETLLLNQPDLNMALSKYLAAKAHEVASHGDEDDEGLHGSLDVLDMPGLIQALNLRQATGSIELPEIAANIDIMAGMVVGAHHPKCPDDDGVASFIQIVAQEPKKFRLQSDPSSKARNVHITTPNLLLETMRWLDESSTPAEARCE